MQHGEFHKHTHTHSHTHTNTGTSARANESMSARECRRMAHNLVHNEITFHGPNYTVFVFSSMMIARVA